MSKHSFGRIAGFALAAAAAAVVTVPSAATAAPLPIEAPFPIDATGEQQTDAATGQVSQLPMDTQDALADLLGPGWAETLPAVLEQLGIDQELMQVLTGNFDELTGSALDPAAVQESAQASAAPAQESLAITDQLLGGIL